MADKEKLQEERKTGGPKMLRPGLGQQTRRKNKKNIEDIVGDTATKNIFSKFRTKVKKAEKQFKEIPSGMKKDPKMRAEIGAKLLKDKNPFREFKDTRREVFATQRMAKGGRAGFKSGSKGCKLAKRGKGRAYGKNS